MFTWLTNLRRRWRQKRCPHFGPHEVIEVYPEVIGLAVVVHMTPMGLREEHVHVHRNKERCLLCGRVAMSYQAVPKEELS